MIVHHLKNIRLSSSDYDCNIALNFSCIVSFLVDFKLKPMKKMSFWKEPFEHIYSVFS